MDDYSDLLLERMRPQQIVLARKGADIVFLPVAVLEWHGVHNPIGVDSINAFTACCRAARRIQGGAVAPTLLWGTPRDSFHVGVNDPLAEEISGFLNTSPTQWQGIAEHGGMDAQEQWLFFARLLRMALEHLAGLGFRSIYICSGHGPLVHWIRPTAVSFTRASRTAGCIVTTDWSNAFEVDGDTGDHGGKTETSIMMAVDDRLVDLGALDHVAGGGVGAGEDAIEATAAFGEAWQEAVAASMAKEARWLVEHYPRLSPRHVHRR